LGEVADFLDRRHVAIHRVHRLEGDELGALAIDRRQQLAQVRDIVVAEDALFHAGLAHALDHRGVIELVGENHTIGQ
jgi:hypothetical protein